MAKPGFHSSSRATQLRMVRSAALSALADYAISPTGVRLIQYEDNAVYRVDSADSRHMLRLSIREGRTVPEQRSETEWTAALRADSGLLAPRVVPAANGEPVSTLDSTQFDEPVTVVLFEWIAGKAAPEYTRGDTAWRLGETTARLHEHAKQYRPGPGFTRPSWGVAEIFDEGPALTSPLARSRTDDADRQTLLDVSAAVGDRMASPGGADWGLIHADLHRGNLVAADDGRIGVIDFDDCGWGHYLLDVATVLSSMYRMHGRQPGAYETLNERYLAGYASVRPLPRGGLDEFLVARDMIIVNFVLSSPNPTVAEWGPHRVRGILSLLRDYLRTGRYAGTLDLSSAHAAGPALGSGR